MMNKRRSVVWRLLMTAGLMVVSVASFGAGGPDTSFCKEVLVLHHSHLDVGFTHPQPMLWELQQDYLDQALEMLDSTADWPEAVQPRWTCEVTAPVSTWLSNATPDALARFKKYLGQGRLGISGLQYNTTPLSGAESLAHQLADVRELRRLGARINTVNLHDTTGLPWPAVDELLDSGIELLIMGINLHLSGTPQPRPAVYRWRGPSGRELLVMNGEHYSMFDQWANTASNNLDTIQQGLNKYLQNLASRHYPYDFVYLSATCAPFAYDNSPPNAELPRLVRQWNESGRQPRIRFVTPSELLERLKRIPREQVPVVSGDWTDYWNFGACSSAAETQLTRRATADLAAAELLQAFAKPEPRLAAITRRAWADVNLYNEHTWGAAGSLDPDALETVAQWQMKAQPAYEGASLGSYLLLRDLQRLAGNPRSFRKQEGVLLVNPTGAPLRSAVPIPPLWRMAGRRIEANLLKKRDRLHSPESGPLCGPVELAPFSWRVIPLAQLKPAKAGKSIKVGRDFIESPDYRLTFDPASGRVTGLLDKVRGWQALDAARPWGFFQLVHEKPDPQVEPSRKAFHVRDAVAERVGKTGWKPEWKAVYSSYTGKVECKVEQKALEATLVLHAQAEGVTGLEQRITLRADSPLIELDARFIKQDVRTPEALYFAFPLNLDAGWRSHFDTAGLPVELDAEQIPGTCRDWVTVDSFVSVDGGGHEVTLYCPDAPLAQVGDFNFGRKHDQIERRRNPLLLAWALNNYWETNFRSTQPGPVELHYAFACHKEFDAAQALTEGQRVFNPPLVHPVASCDGPREGKFLDVQGSGVQVVYVKPADDGQGVIVRLLNTGTGPVEAGITTPGAPITKVWRCGLLEDNREPLAIKNGAAACPLQPRQLTTIRIF